MKVYTINLSGVSYLPSGVVHEFSKGKVKVGDSVSIGLESEAVLDGHFAVIHDETELRIGWIPQLDTIRKYMGDAIEENDRRRHDRELMRYNTSKAIRDQILLDNEINNVETTGVIESLLYKDHDQFNHDGVGVIASVSVSI